MPPPENLTSLAAAKAAMRERIATRRLECAAAAARVVRPLVWLDQVYAAWRRIAPLVELAATHWRGGHGPAGFWSRTKSLLAGARLILDLIRGFRRA